MRIRANRSTHLGEISELPWRMFFSSNLVSGQRRCLACNDGEPNGVFGSQHYLQPAQVGPRKPRLMANGMG